MINLRAASPEALDRAIYLFERALEYDPAYASAWASLGAAFDLKATFLSLPDLAHRAIECERKAIELDPGLVHAYEWLAGAFITLDRFDEAIEVPSGRSLEPSPWGRGWCRARVLDREGMIEGIAELERVLAIARIPATATSARLPVPRSTATTPARMRRGVRTWRAERYISARSAC